MEKDKELDNWGIKTARRKWPAKLPT